MTEPQEERASVHEKAAWVSITLLLLFLFYFHLVPALAGGLIVHVILQRLARKMSGPRMSHGAAKYVAALAMVAFALTASVLLVVLLVGFARGHIGDLPSLFEKMADVVEQTRDHLVSMGLPSEDLDRYVDEGELRTFLSRWLREHASELTRAGGEAGKIALHILMGMVVAVLVFFRKSGPPGKPLAEALAGRICRFCDAFEAVVVAQVEISVINTALTGVYLFGVLKLMGLTLPFSGTLLAVTFIAGLIPVVGNLISNSAIVILSLSVSPWTALSSLGFLIGIHKLEYFINARIVGARIGAAAWEILLAIFAFEVAFGIPGVVLAPIIYAYAKSELAEKGLV